MHNISRLARQYVLDTSDRIGAVHFGGIFSIIDFLVAYYIEDGRKASKRSRSGNNFDELFFSKGHCYLAQLAVLDAIAGSPTLTMQYLTTGSSYFGHPKRTTDDTIFPVSSGALGQAITMANGASLGNKFLNSNVRTWTILGDGELNEGACSEALLFAQQHALNHIFVLDDNKQESLEKTSNILSNGCLKARIEGIGMKFYETDGHDVDILIQVIRHLDSTSGPIFLSLDTIKGKGVSFMEKVPAWHSRRLKNNEYFDASEEIKNVSSVDA
jgi:transketolase